MNNTENTGAFVSAIPARVRKQPKAAPANTRWNVVKVNPSYRHNPALYRTVEGTYGSETEARSAAVQAQTANPLFGGHFTVVKAK